MPFAMRQSPLPKRRGRRLDRRKLAGGSVETFDRKLTDEPPACLAEGGEPSDGIRRFVYPSNRNTHHFRTQILPAKVRKEPRMDNGPSHNILDIPYELNPRSVYPPISLYNRTPLQYDYSRAILAPSEHDRVRAQLGMVRCVSR